MCVFFRVVGAVIALMILPLAANAATVSAQSGNVFINTGEGFKPLVGAADIAAGGQIMVRPGATAVIAYSSQCSVRVGSGRVWQIQSAAPCTGENRFIDMTVRMNQSADNGDTAEAAQCLILGVECTTALVGGAVIGGVTAAVIIATSGSDSPASP